MRLVQAADVCPDGPRKLSFFLARYRLWGARPVHLLTNGAGANQVKI